MRIVIEMDKESTGVAFDVAKLLKEIRKSDDQSFRTRWVVDEHDPTIGTIIIEAWSPADRIEPEGFREVAWVELSSRELDAMRETLALAAPLAEEVADEL
jgi:hypothetical protein